MFSLMLRIENLFLENDAIRLKVFFEHLNELDLLILISPIEERHRNLLQRIISEHILNTSPQQSYDIILIIGPQMKYTKRPQTCLILIMHQNNQSQRNTLLNILQ